MIESKITYRQNIENMKRLAATDDMYDWRDDPLYLNTSQRRDEDTFPTLWAGIMTRSLGRHRNGPPERWWSYPKDIQS